MASDSNNELNNQMMEEFRQGMREFNDAMQKRESFSLRIAKRTTQIIRFTLLGMAILGIAMFFLIWTLTNNMNQITDHMSVMSKDIKAMRMDFHQVATDVKSISKDITFVRKDISALNHSLAFMQTDLSKLNQSVAGMGGNILTIRRILAQMDKSIHKMDLSVNGLDQKVGLLTISVGGMSGNISRMSRDMHTMTAPMRAFGLNRGLK